MNKALLIVSTLIGFIAFGQETQLDLINEKVNSIESDLTLAQKDFDWEILPGITTGSKGILRVWKKKKKIYKIVEEIKYLDYTTRTIIYLENGVPIKIIETEENFEHTKDGLDYSKPVNVFEATLYIFDWENDESKIIRNGKRVFTKGNCYTYDYVPLIENVKNM